MKSILRVIHSLIFLMFLQTCATTGFQVSPKYLLDAQLERIYEIPLLHTTRKSPQFPKFGYGRKATDLIDEGEIKEDILRYGSLTSMLNTVTLSLTKHEWSKVDQQSLIIHGSSSEYYLLVLKTPSTRLLTSDEYISFTPSGSVIKAGIDYIMMGSDSSMKYVIDRLYKIKDYDQMVTIKNQILAE